jgi:tetratricopeptide (TPR) repeat protein
MGTKARAIALLLSVVVIAGCGPANQPAKPAGEELPPVTLPDISRAAAPVQTELRARYARLQQKIAGGTPPTELAGAYGEMGKLFMATEYRDAARACFLRARALMPNEMRWPYYLAHLQRLANEPAKASALFEQTLALQPNDLPALTWLGEMQLAQDRPEAAEAPFAKALTLDPQSTAALYGLGRVALAKRDYAQAVTHLQAALALAPAASRIHYSLAMAYRGLGDQRNAEAHLKQRGDVEVPPADPLMQAIGGLLQNAAAFEVRASQALGRRDWPEAIANLRKAIELAPDNAFSRLNLGTALFQAGDAAGALEQFQAAVRLSPDMAKAHYGIGIVTEAAGRDREAIEAFSAAVRSDPASLEAQMSLADALRRNGRMEESLPLYAEVIKAGPAVSQARFGYAMALVRLKRFPQARDLLAEAAKTFPDQPGFAHALARVLAAAPDANVRDGRQAMAIMQGLLKAQRTLELMQTMAMTLAELGEYEEAANWQREAMAAARQSGRDDLVSRLKDNLTLYENRQPCRTPWPDDDPVFHPRPAK